MMKKHSENVQEKEIKLETAQLQQLKSIDRHLQRMTSLRWTFLSGLTRGVATVLGATIIAAIVFAVLAQMLSSAAHVPVLNTVIKQTGLEDIVGKEIEQKLEQQLNGRTRETQNATDSSSN